MTLLLSGSVNVAGSQLPGGVRGDTGPQLKTGSDFDQFVSDLARSPEAPSENPEEMQKSAGFLLKEGCTGFLLKAGLELPNLLERGEAIDREHVVSDKRDSAPENADRKSDDGVPISNFIDVTPAPFINVLSPTLSLEQSKIYVDTKGRTRRRSKSNCRVDLGLSFDKSSRRVNS